MAKLVLVPFVPRVLGSDLVRKHTEPSVATQSYADLEKAVKTRFKMGREAMKVAVSLGHLDRETETARLSQLFGDETCALKALGDDKEELEAQFAIHNGFQDRRRQVHATRCRAHLCTGEKRKDKSAISGRKVSSGKQMFCGSHAYIRRLMTKEDYQKLIKDVTLRVAV